MITGHSGNSAKIGFVQDFQIQHHRDSDARSDAITEGF
jgi:hypothetical protein